MRACRLRCEYREEPLAIDREQPLLSWQAEDGQRQDAWQVQVTAAEPDFDASALVWDSGRVVGAQMGQIPAAGQELESFQVYYWRVRLWADGNEEPGPWSETASWSMGILDQSQWHAKWLSYPVSGCRDAACFRKTFNCQQPVKRAIAYVSSRGIFEMHLNGGKANDDYFSPGWTDYHKRIYYRGYNVTDLLQQGENVIGAVVSEGWYKGLIGFQGFHVFYGYECMVCVHLRIEYTDGSVEQVCSDETWQTHLSGVLQSSFFMGENVDPAHEPTDWSTTACDVSAWCTPTVFEDGNTYWSQKHGDVRPLRSKLQAHPAEPVRINDEFPAIDCWQTDPGSWIFDLGQNFAGWVRIKLRGKPGTMVRLRFAEVLQTDKTLYVENLRSASSTDTYIMRGDNEEVWEPRFTFHGFQYVEVTGLTDPQLSDVTGIAVSSDCPRSGHFSCSNEDVNKLVSNAWWTQRANFIDIPTDCPQRDERLGWTGDALAFINTAAYNADVCAFFIKWLRDLVDTQMDNGAVTNTAPNGCLLDQPADAAWGDALTGCAWAVYEYYGDRRILEETYPAMQRMLDYYKSTSRDWLRADTHCFGDWLNDEDPTPNPILLTAYFAFSADICARTAEVLGRDDDARTYRDWWQQIVTAFQQRFVKDGMIEGDSQTGLVVALDMNLLPEAERAAAAARLAQKIEERGNRLATGFVGTHLLLPVLSRFGYTQLAYKLLLQKAYPSWLFPIEQGATSIWERWDGWTPEHGPGDPSMNSYAHYSFGAVLEWLYAHVAGIQALEPGFKRVRIAPQPGPGLDWVECSYASQSGLIRSNWRRSDGTLQCQVEVPANVTAHFTAPGTIGSLDGPAALEQGDTEALLGAGDYAIAVTLPT